MMSHPADLATLRVSEVFGPTIQGEGPHTGRRVGFCRLGLCNLTCEWCDTPYTWDATRYNLAEEAPPMALQELERRIEALDVDTMILTGGEPMIHAVPDPDCALALLLSRNGHLFWHLETNGTIRPPDWMPHLVSHWSVSPKINTRDPEKRRIKPKALEWFAAASWTGNVAFKFVCTQKSDLDLVGNLADEHDIAPDAIWVMPEGVTANAVLDHARRLADLVIDRGWNLTLRSHTLLWGTERER